MIIPAAKTGVQERLQRKGVMRGAAPSRPTPAPHSAPASVPRHWRANRPLIPTPPAIPQIGGVKCLGRILDHDRIKRRPRLLGEPRPELRYPPGMRMTLGA